MLLTVARIGRAHGLKGEASVEVRTDRPEERLVVGASFATEPPSAGPLTLAAVREQAGRYFLTFAEARDRSAVEALRDVRLVVESDAEPEDDAWYIHELVGLEVQRPDGRVIGTVTGVEHLPAQDLLVVREVGGATARLPLVEQIVPVVDLAAGRVIADPPFGLLSGEEV